MAYEIVYSLYPMVAALLLCQGMGVLWYGPLFGKQWLAEMNFASMPGECGPPIMPFLLTIVSNVLTTFLMMNVHNILVVSTIPQALLIAFAYWAATDALRIPHYAFGMKSLRLFLIDSFFDLTLVMGVSAVVFYLAK